MKHYWFFKTATGDVLPRRIGITNPAMLANNTPEGYTAVEGELDAFVTQVDPVTQQPLDTQVTTGGTTTPTGPDPDTARMIKAQIAVLQGSQADAVRACILTPSAQATAALQAIDDQITALRAQLQ